MKITWSPRPLGVQVGVHSPGQRSWLWGGATQFGSRDSEQQLGGHAQGVPSSVGLPHPGLVSKAVGPWVPCRATWNSPALDHGLPRRRWAPSQEPGHPRPSEQTVFLAVAKDQAPTSVQPEFSLGLVSSSVDTRGLP